jgi:hypothetical protein
MPRNQTLSERFAYYASPEPNSGCWLWIGSVDRHGYGQIRIVGKLQYATHLALTLDGRPRPKNAVARHSCDTPNCCNPNHLNWGTYKDNSQDALKRSRLDLHGLLIGHERMRAIKRARPHKDCDKCGKSHSPRLEQLQKNKNFFCSKECSVAWQKKSYTGMPIASWSAA